MHTYGLRFDVSCSILFTELPLLNRAAGWIGCEHKPFDPMDSAMTFGWR